ncbi:demethylmenaquinone methyltransferase/2-methoxy-6-polyprenyl-1,4-benzoquinol methylase [Rufibacter quisquiliarum]|uniref:Demethylmenaquinone methyltransferase/2-methoxy-6-polyprenyl-1,4-benzoquinol methylase n=2 Tax=Rufibacter quisquiliarum TaxID=1549639 RepID=A0A839GTN5_9BACT|nr:demethylmenaquinone methyltransferase/2-methoxy-6-polyprenyl-1,4-benzoquinol methylase [Rufibacter quisquiliarum]
MASSYEGMNYLTSFGFSYVWRRQFLQPLPPLQGAVKVADLMTGMGEMWPHLFAKWPRAQVEALDFSEGMLQCAARKNRRTFANRVQLIKADALRSPLPSMSYDVVTCAFGLKTLSREQLLCLARETKRLLKPGGHFAFVEISEPAPGWLQALYLFYLKHLIPLIGYCFAQDYHHYQMLSYYTHAFRNAEEAAEIFKAEGLAVTYQQLFKGCATGFYGTKP